MGAKKSNDARRDLEEERVLHWYHASGRRVDKDNDDFRRHAIFDLRQEAFGGYIC